MFATSSILRCCYFATADDAAAAGCQAVSSFLAPILITIYIRRFLLPITS